MKFRDDEKFPTKFFSLSLGGCTLLIVFIILLSFRSYEYVTEKENHLAKLQSIHDEIIYFDEVLTMSANMAAKTGDDLWLDRYNQHEPKLTNAINEALSLVSNPVLINAINSTKAANSRLVLLENEAFNFIKSGNLNKAWEVMTSAPYQENKNLYKEGMGRSLNELKNIHAQTKENINNQVITQILLKLFLFIILVLLFGLIIFRVRKWNKLVEVLVFERTEKLHEAQKNSIQTERILKKAQSVAQIGNWSLDHQTQSLWWSDEIFRIFGLDPEKDVASQHTYMMTIHPEDLEYVQKTFKDSFVSGKGYAIEHRIICNQSGDEKWVSEICEHVLDDQGQLLRSDGTVQDITERICTLEETQQKDKLIRNVLANIPGYVVATDENLRIVFVNQNYTELYRVPSSFLDKGAYYPDLLKFLAERGDYGPGDPQELFEKRVASLNCPQDLTFEDSPPNGHVYQITRKKTLDGLTITIINDITELKKANQLALEAKETAETANKAKSAFLASISHEIRTPMTGVIGYADLLLEQDLNKESREFTERIKASTDNLLTIVNDLLDISKLESGKMQTDLQDVCLKELITETFNGFSLNRTKEQDFKLYLSISDDFPGSMHTDPTRIRQILINLIGNAIKFTHEGSINVVCDFLKEPDHIRISVRDTGIGISADKLETLFEEFTQADASISRKYEGTGLGLSISKRLVELLGGKIGVQSKENKGSEFWFTLPFEKPLRQIAEIEEKPKSKRFIAQKHLDILLAEDNCINQLLIKKYIEAFGHHVICVPDGRELVDQWKEKKYDLILTDIRMPNMDGAEATRLIRSLETHSNITPIIGITADVIPEHIEEYIKDGINACVYKPINWADLLLTINEVLGEDIHTFGDKADPPALKLVKS